MAKKKKNKQKTRQYKREDDKSAFYRKMLLLQEEEKKKISMDLHDETGQVVIALGASLNLIEKEVKNRNIQKASELIQESRRLIQKITSRMKSMAFTLRPPGLDILGLAAVLREYFTQCTTSSPIKIEFNENTKGIKLREEIEITLYRIVQEAIYNVIKHSEATMVKVDLFISNNKLCLNITDNGKGFDLQSYEKENSLKKMGLRGIRERLAILKSTFKIYSSPQKGTKIEITLPVS